MGIPASRRSAIVFRRTCHTLGSGGLGFVEPSISWEAVAFSALLELANGMEAQPATVDPTMINNVPRIIQADFLSGDIGTPVSRLGVLLNNCEHSTTKHAMPWSGCGRLLATPPRSSVIIIASPKNNRRIPEPPPISSIHDTGCRRVLIIAATYTNCIILPPRACAQHGSAAQWIHGVPAIPTSRIVTLKVQELLS
jgi:hypothetical protein